LTSCRDPEEPLVMKTGEVGRYGGRFVIVGSAGPQTFNPVVSSAGFTSDIVNRLFVHLTTFALDTQEDTPALATAWECARDALSCTFHLRQGAMFSDGHPITTDDVAFSFAAVNDPRVAAYQRDLVQMDGVPLTIEAADPHTIVIRAPKANGSLLSAVSQIAIVPKHVLAPLLERGTFNEAYAVSTSPAELVTSGPWRLKQYLPNERTVLTRNPYWFGVDGKRQRMPYLEELVFMITPDQDTADLKFRSGEADALTRPSPASMEWYSAHQQSGDFALHDVGPDMGPMMIIFNQNEGASAGKEPRWDR
jgi:peptide/nickel transport system substrate-binding protein